MSKITREVRRRLEDLGIQVMPQEASSPEAGEEIWELRLGETTHSVRTAPLEKGSIGHHQEFVREALPRLWIAEQVRPRVADRLVAAGEFYVDAAGNAFVRLPGLVVHVAGRGSQGELPGREWRGPALRALFRLLCEPRLAERPVREAACTAGVAVGTIAHLLAELEQEGNIVRLGGRKRRFVPDRGLVDRWLDAYARRLRPRLLVGRFEAADPEAWERLDPTAFGALWGGERAGALLGADLRPAVHTLYAAKPIRRILRAARLRPAGRGPIEIRETFWSGEIPAPREDVVPPLLVVADLRAMRDARCREAAEHVEEAYLAGPLR